MVSNMKKIAIIPARGGSKRIPRKNINFFNGKPIIAYSIEIAQESGLFSDIIVSTDDEEISQIARSYGASVPFVRSEINSSDHASTADVLLEVLRNFEQAGQDFTYCCCIYPAAPFIKKEDLIEGIDKLISENFNVVFPVVKYDHPVWRGYKLLEGNKVEANWPEYYNSRSQDLPSLYHDAGQWYWFTVDKFLKNRVLLDSNTASIVLSSVEVQDIDTVEDWMLAEMKYIFLNKKK